MLNGGRYLDFYSFNSSRFLLSSDSREDDFNFFSHETKPALASRIKNSFFFPSPRFQPIKINLNLMTLVYDERLKTPGIGEVFFFFF